jgi:hypothetical protein
MHTDRQDGGVDMRHGHGHVAWTCSARACSLVKDRDMQPGHEHLASTSTWPSSIDIDMQHKKWILSMDMNMQHGNGKLEVK